MAKWITNKENYKITNAVAEWLRSMGKLEDFMEAKSFTIKGGTYVQKGNTNAEDFYEQEDFYFSYDVVFTRIVEDKQDGGYYFLHEQTFMSKQEKRTKGRPYLGFIFQEGDSDGNWDCLSECANIEIHTKKDISQAEKIINRYTKNADDFW